MAHSHITRQSKHDAWLNVAFEISQRGTCIRRAVGCVLLDKHGRVLATGYNGVAAGDVHCIDKPCSHAAVSAGQGQALGECQSIHAEENALQQCKDDQAIETIYCVASPCLDRCLRKLKSTSAKEIVFVYGYNLEHDAKAKEIWESSREGRKWTRVDLDTRTWLPYHEDMPAGYYWMRNAESMRRGSESIVQMYGNPRRDPRQYEGKLLQRIEAPSYERRLEN